MQTTLERPADSAGMFTRRLAIQERRRQKAIQRLARLRKEASDQIEKLLAFLDTSDPYVMNELEINGDELDASYPESGVKATNPMEDDEEDDAGEDDGTGEWSLGFLERSASVYGPSWGRDGSGDQSSHILSQGHGGDREDQHDGAEPDDDGEPSLGWGLNGEKGNTGAMDYERDDCDRESDEPLLTECSGGGV